MYLFRIYIFLIIYAFQTMIYGTFPSQHRPPDKKGNALGKHHHRARNASQGTQGEVHCSLGRREYCIACI